MSLGVNYLPMLIYAVLLVRGRIHSISPSAADGAEMWRYTRQMFLLLIPLLVPLVAVWQEFAKAPDQPFRRS